MTVDQLKHKSTARALKQLLNYTTKAKQPLVFCSRLLWEESRPWEGPAYQEWPRSFLVHGCTLSGKLNGGGSGGPHAVEWSTQPGQGERFAAQWRLDSGGFGWSSCPIWGMWHTDENDTRVGVFFRRELRTRGYKRQKREQVVQQSEEVRSLNKEKLTIYTERQYHPVLALT